MLLFWYVDILHLSGSIPSSELSKTILCSPLIKSISLLLMFFTPKSVSMDMGALDFFQFFENIVGLEFNNLPLKIVLFFK